MIASTFPVTWLKSGFLSPKMTVEAIRRLKAASSASTLRESALSPGESAFDPSRPGTAISSEISDPSSSTQPLRWYEKVRRVNSHNPQHPYELKAISLVRFGCVEVVVKLMTLAAKSRPRNSQSHLRRVLAICRSACSQDKRSRREMDGLGGLRCIGGGEQGRCVEMVSLYLELIRS